MYKKPINEWDKYNSIVIQNDMEVFKRKSTYTIVCLDCESKRTVGYAQAWNIVKNKNSGRCQSCAEKIKEKKPKKIKDISKNRLKEYLKYKNLFDNPSKKPEIQEKMRNAKLGKFGELANRWDNGKTKERILLTSRDEYKQLRLSIFKRDEFKCVLCDSSGYLEMDHIKEWCNYPELRYEPTNLRTLCSDCHKNSDNFGSKALRRKSVGSL